MTYPRVLNDDERRVLHHLLSLEFDGVQELRAQAETARVTAGCGCGCPTTELTTDPRTPASSARAALAPVEGRVVGTGDTAPADILLFLTEGRLSSIEYVYYDNEVPSRWPLTTAVELVRIAR